jgi:hypothetical protein
VLPADATPPARHEDGPLSAADGWEVHRPAAEPGTELERLDANPAALPRVRLQLAAAVREGDRARAGDLAELAGATLLERRRRRRWRRRPALLRWLLHTVHIRRNHA